MYPIILHFRSIGPDMVRILAVAVLREAEPPSNYIGQGIELHRIVVGRRQTVSRADNPQHALERIFHLHARIRHHSRQLLQVVELLSSRAVPGIVPALVQLRSVCSELCTLLFHIIYRMIPSHQITCLY